MSNSRSPKPKVPRGRPSTFSWPVANAICDQLALGESLFKICKANDYPPESTVRLWVVDDVEGFAAKYERSRNIGLDSRADRMLEDAHEATDAGLGRLRMDANRWYLSKLAPKRYGDKQQIEHSDPDGKPLGIAVTFVSPAAKPEA